MILILLFGFEAEIIMFGWSVTIEFLWLGLLLDVIFLGREKTHHFSVSWTKITWTIVYLDALLPLDVIDPNPA